MAVLPEIAAPERKVNRMSQYQQRDLPGKQLYTHACALDLTIFLDVLC